MAYKGHYGIKLIIEELVMGGTCSQKSTFKNIVIHFLLMYLFTFRKYQHFVNVQLFLGL